MTTRRTFVAEPIREGTGWLVAVDVPEMVTKGGRCVWTQAGRLDQVEGMTRDLVALLLNVKPDSFDVEVRPRLAGDLAERVEQARQLRAHSEQASEEMSKVTRKLVADLLADGYRVREVALLVGLSFQRVSQLARTNPVSTGNTTEKREESS